MFFEKEVEGFVFLGDRLESGCERTWGARERARRLKNALWQVGCISSCQMSKLCGYSTSKCFEVALCSQGGSCAGGGGRAAVGSQLAVLCLCLALSSLLLLAPKRPKAESYLSLLSTQVLILSTFLACFPCRVGKASRKLGRAWQAIVLIHASRVQKSMQPRFLPDHRQNFIVAITTEPLHTTAPLARAINLANFCCSASSVEFCVIASRDRAQEPFRPQSESVQEVATEVQQCIWSFLHNHNGEHILRTRELSPPYPAGLLTSFTTLVTIPSEKVNTICPRLTD